MAVALTDLENAFALVQRSVKSTAFLGTVEEVTRLYAPKDRNDRASQQLRDVVVKRESFLTAQSECWTVGTDDRTDRVNYRPHGEEFPDPAQSDQADNDRQASNLAAAQQYRRFPNLVSQESSARLREILPTHPRLKHDAGHLP